MNIATATSEIMSGYRRPIKPLYLRFDNTREIEPGMYESGWLKKQLAIYCHRDYDHYFKELIEPISITSIDGSGTKICMTINTKLSIEELKHRIATYPIKIEVSNNFFYN